MANPEQFHGKQKQHMQEDMFDPNRKAVHDSWFREDTVDYWRQDRMFKMVAPLAEFYREAAWVTIGDGRYGLDSYMLKKLYGIHVLPTDIAGNMLERGKELGLFDDYRVENAESLDFAKNSFDVVFCKEALHHMPRPLIAVYEMIRVSRKAVIILEPNDSLAWGSPLKFAGKLLRQLWIALSPSTRWNNTSYLSVPPAVFEPSGNYVYWMSKREMAKVVNGLNMAGLAWLGINDHYIKGSEFEAASPQNPIFRETVSKIRKRDKLCRRLPYFVDYDSNIIVLFKEEIQPGLRVSMEQSGFVFPKIEKNPYF